MIARPFGDGEVTAASDALARAFQDDPVFSWLFPDDAERRARLPRFFAETIRALHLQHGLCFTTDEHAGAAVWDPPGKWQVGLLTQARLAPRMVAVFGRRVFKLLSLLGAIQKQHLAEPHYYLFAIGTDPAWQNRGVGTALLEPGLARCDAERMPAYLESSNERNLPFYRRHGFETTGEVRAAGAPKLTLMRRAPR
jgi:ribosomal protein S18 acetylase RimI-like enzyme